MPRRPLRYAQTIDQSYSGTLEIPTEDRYFGHAIVRDESQKKGYRCHLYLDPGEPNSADLVLRVIAQLAVPWHVSGASES
jgi:hypothetical protein